MPPLTASAPAYLTSAQSCLLAYIATHFAGLLATIGAGFLFALWVTGWFNRSLPVRGRRGELAVIPPACACLLRHGYSTGVVDRLFSPEGA